MAGLFSAAISLAGPMDLRPAAGPLELTVVFPGPLPAGRAEPLLSVGQPEAGDVVFVHYHDKGLVSFGWENSQKGSVLSLPLPLGDGKAHRVIISLGCMAADVPAGPLDEKTRANLLRLKSSAILIVDNVPVMVVDQDFPAAPPQTPRIGVNHVGGAMAGPRFSGQISEVRSVSPDRLWRLPAAAAGPVRMKVRFPSNRLHASEPLLVTGRTGGGDFVYVRYEGPDKVRFGFDHWGSGGPVSDLIETNLSHEHEIIISTIALLPPVLSATGDFYAGLRERNVVLLDGRIVLDAAGPNHPTTIEQITLGRNRIGGSPCEAEFTGRIESSGRASTEDVIRLLWPPSPLLEQVITSNGAGYPGPIRLRMKFPSSPADSLEPLLGTGVYGAGDLLSVRYESDGRVRFSLDHWGYRNLVSAPVPVDRAQEHELVISLGSLLPPPEPETPALERLRRRCFVLFDGQVVMDVPSEFHPALPNSIRVGVNAISASDAVPAFTGRIEAVQSVPVAAVLDRLR